MAKKKRKKKSRKIGRLSVVRKKTDVNISKAIVTITNSFIENNLDDDDPDLESLMRLSFIAWNISLFPEMNQEVLYEKIAGALSPSLGAQGIAGFVKIVEKIMDEKRKHYPEVNRLIEKYDISVIDGEIKLSVKSIRFGNKRV